MRKEALLVLVYVVSSIALVTMGLAKRPVGSLAPERDRAVFAGGPENGARPVARPERVRGVRAIPGKAGDAVVRLRPGRSVMLHARPGGRRLIAVGDRTPFGSDTVLPVVGRRAGWLGELSSAVAPNGAVAWIRDDPRALAARHTGLRVVVDRSDRRLTVLRHGRVTATTTVGVGRPGSQTPTGRFAVTDKLPGSRFTSSSYGCCILALTGRQPSLPAGWRGGDRLAIHGTDGRSATSDRSAGCVTVDAAPLRRLMDSVPLGTVVTVRP